MDWKAILTDLRIHLPHGGRGGLQRGSLRWLEGQMREKGGNPAALRNIVYRDVGTAADKQVLAAILRELGRETGRLVPLPHAPLVAPLPDELELLGRTKKRIYKQFTASLRAGRFPKLAVTGRAGAGKSVLLEQLAHALGQMDIAVKRLNLTGDVSSGDLSLAQRPASTSRSAIGVGSSFAERAARQAQAARQETPTHGALLLRVTADLNFAGDPPRLNTGEDAGQVCTPACWAYETFVRPAPAGLAVLLALEDKAGWPADAPEVAELRPPTPTEGRAYLMQKLGVSRAMAEQLLKQTGRNLDRLTLLAGAGGDAAQLLADPDLRRVTLGLAALHLYQPLGGYSAEIWQAVLGHNPAQLPVHVRSQLQQVGAKWEPSPPLRQAVTLLPAAEKQSAVRQLAQAAPQNWEVKPFWFAALASLQDWPGLLNHLQAAPDDARFLPELWASVRAAAPVPEREALARLVVTHHAGRGEYHDARARDALFSLLESEDRAVRIWGRVKLAESSVDAGNFEAAQVQLAGAEVQQAFAGSQGGSWLLSARSDALLVEAALARWQGDIAAATQAVSDPRTAQSGARARLWRGLIAKDAGRWPEALGHLQAVPSSSPLLSARARYQEGDLRLRIGQPLEALSALLNAAQRLEQAGGSADELARILARAATAQRRLGQAELGLRLMERALSFVPAEARTRSDGVPRARLISENIPILLALNRPQDALVQGAQALALLALPGPRRAEAEYRTRRTYYRVALTYLTRGVGLPYLQPFTGAERDSPDLAFARELLDQLLRRPVGNSDREQVLAFDMLLSRALVETDPLAALDYVSRALDMSDHPYSETQARAMRAEASLRAGHTGAALGEINRAHSLLRRVQLGVGAAGTADPGLAAQLLALEAAATIGDGVQTLNWLREALHDPALRPFRAGIWRGAGTALEKFHPNPRQVLEAFDAGARALPLRVPDALAVLDRLSAHSEPT